LERSGFVKKLELAVYFPDSVIAPFGWRGKPDNGLIDMIINSYDFTEYIAGLWIRIDAIRIRIRVQKFSSIRIRIRIHTVIESGFNPDPDTDPQQYRYFRRQIISKIKNSTKKSKILAVCTIFIPFR
jgi:hypothetical protein